MRPGAESLAATRVRRSLLRDASVNWQLHLPLLYLLIFKYVPMWGAQVAFRDFFAVSAILMTALNSHGGWRASGRAPLCVCKRGSIGLN